LANTPSPAFNTVNLNPLGVCLTFDLLQAAIVSSNPISAIEILVMLIFVYLGFNYLVI
jgi:hypothetical protein